MEAFDRDFPGHYLRLIKRVRTSVIALIPPIQGIHASLTNAGVSRVVIGPDPFQTVTIQREPETVALSTALNATGLLELESQADMILPFENSGVSAVWEFQLPKASNQFDYRTIADVLVTIDYTALHNRTYYQQVVQSLKPTLQAERPFRFRSELADQWSDLSNPKEGEPISVKFTTGPEDFTPNLDNITISHLTLYFAGRKGDDFEVAIERGLRFTEAGQHSTIGGSVSVTDRILSTRRGNGSVWLPIQGRTPVGEWELTLPNDPAVVKLFTDGAIEDILFVITYTGRTAPWSM